VYEWRFCCCQQAAPTTGGLALPFYLPAPAAAAAAREVVVDPASDEFYRSHLFANYGKVGLSVKELVDKFSSQSAAHKQVRLRGISTRSCVTSAPGVDVGTNLAMVKVLVNFSSQSRAHKRVSREELCARS
jgi:hypothetical protein